MNRTTKAMCYATMALWPQQRHQRCPIFLNQIKCRSSNDQRAQSSVLWKSWFNMFVINQRTKWTLLWKGEIVNGYEEPNILPFGTVKEDCVSLDSTGYISLGLLKEIIGFVKSDKTYFITCSKLHRQNRLIDILGKTYDVSPYDSQRSHPLMNLGV